MYVHCTAPSNFSQVKSYQPVARCKNVQSFCFSSLQERRSIFSSTRTIDLRLVTRARRIERFPLDRINFPSQIAVVEKRNAEENRCRLIYANRLPRRRGEGKSRGTVPLPFSGRVPLTRLPVIPGPAFNPRNVAAREDFFVKEPIHASEDIISAACRLVIWKRERVPVVNAT